MFSSRWLVAAAVLGAAGNAYALKPGTHADITKKSCVAAGLPKDFCQRAATEDYDTDAREWDDLRAHAQIDDGQTACEAADGAAGRVWHLGSDLRSALAAVARRPSDDNVGDAASALGRALHTIQDDCAHHGMPNPQHAWFSMSDFCDGTALSPDVQEDAIACARAETDAIMQEVADAVATAGVARSLDRYACPDPNFGGPHNNHETPVCQKRFLPGPIDACSFLARAKEWDGIDRTWDNGIVVPALHDAFAAGLAGVHATSSICQGNEAKVAPAVSQPIVDVAGGPASCFRSSLFCLGKADGTDNGDNPFADDPSDPSTDGTEVGCAVGGSSHGLLLVAGVLLLAIRRRRRH